MLSLLDLLHNRLASLVPSELKPSELHRLLSPHRHALLLTQRRATMIVKRVRLFAFLFAVPGVGGFVCAFGLAALS